VHPDLVRMVEHELDQDLGLPDPGPSHRARRQPDHELPASHRPRHRSCGAGESAIYDTDGFANLGAQPTRLAAPPARVLPGSRCCAACSELLGDVWVEILKNRVEIDGLPRYLRPTVSSRARIGLALGPIAAAVEADPQTWFAIVAIVFAAFRGALVRLTATESVEDWDTLAYDPRRPSTLRTALSLPSGPPRERKRVRPVGVTAERSRSKYRDLSPQGGFP
jgi:hypothetical protein